MKNEQPSEKQSEKGPKIYAWEFENMKENGKEKKKWKWITYSKLIQDFNDNRVTFFVVKNYISLRGSHIKIVSLHDLDNIERKNNDSIEHDDETTDWLKGMHIAASICIFMLSMLGLYNLFAQTKDIPIDQEKLTATVNETILKGFSEKIASLTNGKIIDFSNDMIGSTKATAILKELNANSKIIEILEKLEKNKALTVGSVSEIATELSKLKINSAPQTNSDKKDNPPIPSKEEILKTVAESLKIDEIITKILMHESNKTLNEKLVKILTDHLFDKGNVFTNKFSNALTEKLNNILTEVYNKPENKTRFTESLVNTCIDKKGLQEAIVKGITYSKSKAIIIPTQDFNPTTSDKDLFIGLISRLLEKRKELNKNKTNENSRNFQLFIDRNGRLIEISEDTKSTVLNENFNNVVCDINEKTIRQFLEYTKFNTDCIFVRGPNSNVAPENNNRAWFNGNKCSVIYTSKGNITNKDDLRINQWLNWTNLNRGSIRVTISEEKDNTQKYVDSIMNEIDSLN